MTEAERQLVRSGKFDELVEEQRRLDAEKDAEVYVIIVPYSTHTGFHLGYFAKLDKYSYSSTLSVHNVLQARHLYISVLGDSLGAINYCHL